MESGGGPYVDVAYATEGKAEEARQDLLRPYPEGHAWRRRLYIKRHALVARASVRVSTKEERGDG